MWEQGNLHNKPYRKSARIVGDVIGKYHPHGESADLRHGRAHGAGVLAALPARRRPGQLRLDRRRQRRRDALHRGPPDAPRRARCSATTSTRRPSTGRRTTTARSSSRRCCRRSSRTCSSTAPRASPSAWRPTSRRTTSPRSSTRRSSSSSTPTRRSAQLMKKLPGPDFPTAGFIHGAQGIRDAYKTGRGIVQVRARAVVEKAARGDKEAIVVTEIPYQVNKAQADRADRRARQRQEDRGHRATCATSPTARACASSSS